MPRKTNRSGFTLLEVMVAMICLTAVSLGVTSYISSIQKARVRARSRLTSRNMAQGIMEEVMSPGVLPAASTAIVLVGPRRYKQIVKLATVNNTTTGSPAISYSVTKVTVKVFDLAFKKNKETLVSYKK